MKAKKLSFLGAHLFMLLCVSLGSTRAYSQKAILRGTVVDEKSGEVLVHANIEVKSSKVQTGAATGMDGVFEVKNLTLGTYTIRVSYIGYETKTLSIVIAVGGTVSQDISLTPIGISFNPVIVTAGRRPEKVLEAPADVLVLPGDQIAARPVLTPAEHLKSAAAIDVLTTGINSANVVVRGFNNVFSTKLWSLVDNRISQVPSLRVNAYQFLPTSSEDIENVEIVLGPGSALYGPNSAGGVIHFITKSPITSPGIAIGLGVGERNVFMETFRYARKVNDHVGFKISGQYNRGNDFEFSDSTEVAERNKAINGGADPGTLKIGVRDFGVEKLSTEALLEFRLNEHTKLIFNGGFNIGSNIELTAIGAGQAIDWTSSYVQARFNYRNLFVQGFINRSDAGDTYLLRSGDPIVDHSKMFVGQIQHQVILGDRQRFTYGLDALLTRPDTDHTINGRNENNDDINELGAYFQSETELFSKLKVVGAARIDHHNRLKNLIFSPRAAIVFKPTFTDNFRLTYNRAFSTPSATNLFLDILSSEDVFGLGAAFDDPGFAIGLRAQGVPETGFNFRRSGNGLPQFRSPFSVLDPRGISKSDFIDLNDPIFTNVMWSLARAKVLAALEDELRQAIEGIVPRDIMAVENSLGILDLSDPSTPQFNQIPDVFDIGRLKETITQTIEFGYKGIIGNKLALGVDFYHTEVTDFIGPGLIETPNVFLDPTTLAAFLTQTFDSILADPNNAALSNMLTRMLDDPGRGGNGNGRADDELTKLFVSGAVSIPFGTVSPQEAFDPTAVILTDRNFGNISLNGADIHFIYYLSRNWNIGGNYSYYSKNLFAKSGETQSQNIVLNAPKHKFGVMLNYRNPNLALHGNLRLRFVDSFPVNSGVYTGHVERYAILDLNVGYTLPFSPDTRLSLNVQNLTNNRHREVVGAPKIGRLSILRLTQTF